MPPLVLQNGGAENGGGGRDRAVAPALLGGPARELAGLQVEDALGSTNPAARLTPTSVRVPADAGRTADAAEARCRSPESGSFRRWTG